jgi:deoxyribodipyrimidine photolyase-related protein
MPTLRLILGDQLNHTHSWYQQNDEDVTYILMEMRQETDYVAHHIQKVIAFFVAMRALADYLREQGHRVLYYTLDDPNNKQSLTDNLSRLIQEEAFDHFEYQLPDEWRLDQQLKAFCADLHELGVSSQYYDTEHFLSSRTELEEHFKGKKTYVLESFYRMMRRKHAVLMDGNEPLTGQWNYDADNRKSLPKKHQWPAPLLLEKDVSDIVAIIEKVGVKTIGRLTDPKRFGWATTRKESLEVLDYFVTNLLVHFGDYQDAMTPEGWALYHSRLSFVMNAKLLHPLEVINAVVGHWQENQDTIGFSQVEGFVRQIIGWREYMRGVYWAKMPEYATLNKLDHTRALPSWYWTGETKMHCLSHAIGQSLDHAYAHHIQRLMVTGNFALLAGIHPDELDAWYLGIYIDAIEWVEITNTRGMSQFADGGIVGTKPYVSSANYIDKMSHYCGSCHYDKKKKTGEKACPFNSLYWQFYDRHRTTLEKNPRVGMVYPTWKRMKEEDQKALITQANHYLETINEL